VKKVVIEACKKEKITLTKKTLLLKNPKFALKKIYKKFDVRLVKALLQKSRYDKAKKERII